MKGCRRSVETESAAVLKREIITPDSVGKCHRNRENAW